MRVAESASAPVSGSSIPIVTSFSSARTGVKPAEADNARANAPTVDSMICRRCILIICISLFALCSKGYLRHLAAPRIPSSLWSYARDRPPPQLPPMPAGMPDHPYLKFSLLRLSDGFRRFAALHKYANLVPVLLRPQHVLFGEPRRAVPPTEPSIPRVRPIRHAGHRGGRLRACGTVSGTSRSARRGRRDCP